MLTPGLALHFPLPSLLTRRFLTHCRGEAVQVRRVQLRLHHPVPPDAAQAGAHGREALPVPLVRLQVRAPSGGAGGAAAPGATAVMGDPVGVTGRVARPAGLRQRGVTVTRRSVWDSLYLPVLAAVFYIEKFFSICYIRHVQAPWSLGTPESQGCSFCAEVRGRPGFSAEVRLTCDE